MSRIGKKPIAIPKGVKLKIDNGAVEVTGPKGTLHFARARRNQVRVDGDQLIAERESTTKRPCMGSPGRWSKTQLPVSPKGSSASWTSSEWATRPSVKRIA